ncbi:MAG: hydrogenase accessory protein HypB [endosymbiont of Escarpia spicata]|uniref:Hydrogenase maturation factor HypB n=1 Tax=endosymbiont of Escarpia spicata TaxID=2200908 RepID=A0A370DMU2_9GAMM|nr:MAG: hydrogenase accessory protein HypB [endosymbiont of Escarpia spicata]
MCDTCGCNVTQGNRHLIEAGGKHEHTHDGKVAVEVLQNLLSENDHQAGHNRQHFDNHGVLAVNLMSSPGSGKTSLLEATIDALNQEFRIAVIEGDLETENDAERIRSKGISAVQITTGTACHLDAHMVHSALHQLNLDDLDIVFVENVGNLVCPASFDLGQHLNVTLLSVTEGDDKPAKYPVIFRAADAVLITKSDLLPYLDDFKPEQAEQAIRHLASEAPVLNLSARNSSTLDNWLTWLRKAFAIQAARRAAGETTKPKIQPSGEKLHAHG